MPAPKGCGGGLAGPAGWPALAEGLAAEGAGQAPLGPAGRDGDTVRVGPALWVAGRD